MAAIREVEMVKQAMHPRAIWGNWLYENSLVLVSGEPGAKKTTFLYALTRHLVDNQPFLGVPPSVSGLRVIYCDFESADALIKSRLEAGIGYPARRDRFLILNELGCTIPDVQQQIVNWRCQHRQGTLLLVVDCLRAAFNIVNENDNAEASRAMRALRQLMQELSPCVVMVVHHSAKSGGVGVNKPAGAGARAALADILWNIDRREDWPEGVIRWSVAKNRFVDDYLMCFIKASMYRFQVCPPPRTEVDQFICGMTNYDLQERLLAALVDYPKSVTLLCRELGCPRRTLYRALTCLLATGQATQHKRGYYQRGNGRHPLMVADNT